MGLGLKLRTKTSILMTTRKRRREGEKSENERETRTKIKLWKFSANSRPRLRTGTAQGIHRQAAFAQGDPNHPFFQAATYPPWAAATEATEATTVLVAETEKEREREKEFKTGTLRRAAWAVALITPSPGPATPLLPLLPLLPLTPLPPHPRRRLVLVRVAPIEITALAPQNPNF